MTRAAGESLVARDFERVLAQARKRVHRAAIRARISKAITWSISAAAGVAGGYAFLSVVAVMLGLAHPIGPGVFCLAVFGAMIVAATIPIARAATREPSWQEAAERLDLAAADHNRVANGLALVDQEDSPFARAAVADGWATLEQLHDRAPATADLAARRSWPKSRVAVCLVCIALGILSYYLPPNQHADDPMPALAGSNAALALPPIGPVAETPRKSPEPRPALRSERAAASTSMRNDATVRGGTASRNRLSPGHPRPGNSGLTRSVDRASAATGEASGASSRAQTRPRQPNRDADSRPANQSGGREQQPVRGAQASSAVSGGSFGSSAASVIQHDWALREQAVAGEQEENEEDAPIEDEHESNRQRGGVQPSLKDRAAAPSRDLGISGDQGPPGTGRGGPTPPKKSRGTASLVLGVPMPDFVRGRMGPGTTKTTHDRVDPLPREGEPTKPVDTTPRTLPELPARGEFIPPAWRQIIRDYLVARHSADRIATESNESQE